MAAVYVLALVWLLGKAALFREKVPAGVPPDERAHVSFVAYLQESGRLLPRYEEMRILDDAGGFGPLSSYLPHPALYYALLEQAVPPGGGSGRLQFDVLTARLRRATAPLFAVAAALFLYLGARRTVPLAEHVVYAAVVATVPPLAFIGAAVNNDALGFLAGGLALFGLARWLEGTVDARTATLLGAGASLALLSKLTVGLLVAFAVVGALLLTRRSALPSARRRLALVALPWLVLPALHFVPVVLRYGTPIPSLDVTHPAAILPFAHVAGPPADPMTLARWGVMVGRIFAATWFSIVGHVWLPTGPPLALVAPLLVLALAAVGLFAPQRAEPDGDRAAPVFARIGAGAFALTLLLNSAWSYAGYAEAGRVGAISARYYLPALPCLAVAATLGFRRLAARTWLAVLLAAFLVLGDARLAARYLALFPAQAAAGGELRPGSR